MQKRYRLQLNSAQSIQELLQETYNEACKNIEEAQQQINKITSSVQLNDETLDQKAKYAKAINDFIATKDKAVGRKLEISKLMGEILKYNGDVNKALSGSDIAEKLDIDELQTLINRMDNEKQSNKEYVIK